MSFTPQEMELFCGLPSFKSDEPLDFSILDAEIEFGEQDGISKVSDYIYVLERNCNGIYGEEQKTTEWERFLFRLMYSAYQDTGDFYNFEDCDNAKYLFEYSWSLVIMKNAHEQAIADRESTDVVMEEPESKEMVSSTGGTQMEPSSIIQTVLLVLVTGMLLFVAPQLPSVGWIGFALFWSYFVYGQMCATDDKRKQSKDLEEQDMSPEKVVNAYISLISCSICYKTADPTTYKTEMRQFGCRHAICTSCSLEQIRHHWNDRSEHRSLIRCPMCCKPSRTEPLAIHYI